MKGNAILFSSERYGMRNHASWGSMEDAFLVFLNQDAYDKYRLSKEDYELQKELEKEQKKAVEAKDAKKTKDGAKYQLEAVDYNPNYSKYTDDKGNKFVVNYAGGDGNDIVVSARGNGFSIVLR